MTGQRQELEEAGLELLSSADFYHSPNAEKNGRTIIPVSPNTCNAINSPPRYIPQHHMHKGNSSPRKGHLIAGRPILRPRSINSLRLHQSSETGMEAARYSSHLRHSEQVQRGSTCCRPHTSALNKSGTSWDRLDTASTAWGLPHAKPDTSFSLIFTCIRILA